MSATVDGDSFRSNFGGVNSVNIRKTRQVFSRRLCLHYSRENDGRNIEHIEYVRVSIGKFVMLHKAAAKSNASAPKKRSHREPNLFRFRFRQEYGCHILEERKTGDLQILALQIRQAQVQS